MRYNDGDVEKADYFLNCSWFEYYERLRNKKDWVDWKNEQIKEATKS